MRRERLSLWNLSMSCPSISPIASICFRKGQLPSERAFFFPSILNYSGRTDLVPRDTLSLPLCLLLAMFVPVSVSCVWFAVFAVFNRLLCRLLDGSPANNFIPGSHPPVRHSSLALALALALDLPGQGCVFVAFEGSTSLPWRMSAVKGSYSSDFRSHGAVRKRLSHSCIVKTYNYT